MGCEYFCIDAGWYADGDWWDSVGLWLPSPHRFPGGIEQVLSAIKERGMIPGLWLELEVVGINSPLAREVPDDWFFCRHGKRVIDHGRYQLDFRHPDVRAHADEVVHRLVSQYGVGYIKMDYNINAGIGTDVNADSAGDGLLEHNRAYLDWLDGIFARYRGLVIENCGSGGMRMDYALLSRYSIQSSSDQTDYRRTAAIAAACPSAVTPEQCAVWSYPLPEGDEEEVIFNMVNALVLRIHQSGLLTLVSPQRRALVKEAITLYKEIRQDIPHSLPFWPLGVPAFEDQWLSLALHCHRTTYLAVWRLESASPSHVLPIKYLKGKQVQSDCIYPSRHSCQWQWQSQRGALSVCLPRQNTARLFRLLEEQTP
jgi:alpha-galactosidase